MTTSALSKFEAEPSRVSHFVNKYPVDEIFSTKLWQ